MKDIKDYEGLYAITSCGKVWSYKSGKFLKPIPDRDGYLKVNLYKDDNMRTFLVHRLVAIAYVPNPNGLPEVNHLDEVKNHDWVSNLEWCEHIDNLNYGTRNERASASLKGRENKKSSAPKKKVYCFELDMAFNSQSEASKQTGVSQADISKCCHCNRESAGKHPVTGEPLHWVFALM